MGSLLIFKQYQVLKGATWVIDECYGGKDEFLNLMEELKKHLQSGGGYEDFFIKRFYGASGNTRRHKAWEEYNSSEKIETILKSQWYLQDYTEYATQQRYLKQFDSSIMVDPYVIWVKKLVESGKI